MVDLQEEILRRFMKMKMKIVCLFICLFVGMQASTWIHVYVDVFDGCFFLFVFFKQEDKYVVNWGFEFLSVATTSSRNIVHINKDQKKSHVIVTLFSHLFCLLAHSET